MIFSYQSMVADSNKLSVAQIRSAKIKRIDTKISKITLLITS